MTKPVYEWMWRLLAVAFVVWVIIRERRRERAYREQEAEAERSMKRIEAVLATAARVAAEWDRLTTDSSQAWMQTVPSTLYDALDGLVEAIGDDVEARVAEAEAQVSSTEAGVDTVS